MLRVCRSACVTMIILTCGLMSLFPLSRFAQAAQTIQAPFSLTISAEKSIVEAGTDVSLFVVKKNTSERTISIYRAVSPDSDQGGWVYKVTVRTEDGAQVPETRFGKAVQPPETHGGSASSSTSAMVGSGGYIPLAPGQTVTDHINVSKLYELSRAGRYTLQVKEFDPGSGTFVESNLVTVTVSSPR
jgi:hypothetical protein